ncbi:MAG: hypothetical protein AABW59_03720 [archaeon]
MDDVITSKEESKLIAKLKPSPKLSNKNRKIAEANNRSKREAARETEWKKSVLGPTAQSIMDASK